MRRNMSRRNNLGNNTAGGPLMTGHLQDIDMELELLKRKREMIEQQQQLLVMEQQFKSSRHYDSYDQMRYDELDQHGSDRNYSSLYDNGPKHHHQFGRKRQAEFPWQYDGSSKRTPPKRKSNQSHFNPNQGPGSRYPKSAPGPSNGSKTSSKEPAPLMGVKVKPYIGQKILNQKKSPKPPQKEFAATKVSKPKASPAPNKIASQPLAARKKLVSVATESVSDVEMSRMLLPDRVPTQQVTGRLELALGAIMKNIRDTVTTESPYATMLRSQQLQRVMKQAVRERIRTVMLGKIVGSLSEILEVYREEFPEETDMDIVNMALEAAGIPASEREERSKMIETEDPDIFFKRNMSCLIETKVVEMFEDLEKLYAGKAPAAPTDTENEKKVMDLKKKSEEMKALEDTKEYKSFLNMDIKARDAKRFLPRLMKKFIPYIIKMLDIDGTYQSTKAVITKTANKKAEEIALKNKGNENRVDDNIAILDSPSTASPPQNLPYFVKIMGRPTLPKKKVMQSFLTQFNPKSIKKHRTIHNLLFVGFSEENDYSTMVAADGTVIGRSTLSVRVCTKTGNPESTVENPPNNDTDFSVDVSAGDEVKKETNIDSDMITADLDGQITDLLSSIRKSEEDDDKENRATDEANNGEIQTDAVTEQDNQEFENNENISDENQTTLTPGDAEDENMDDNNQDNENDNQENTTESTEVVKDNLDETVEIPEENIEDQSTADVEANGNKDSDEAETQDSEATNVSETQNSELTNTKENNSETTNQEENNPETATDTEGQIKGDKLGDLKGNASGRSTPTRASARLASVTPSTIVTRRTSRLINN